MKEAHWEWIEIAKAESMRTLPGKSDELVGENSLICCWWKNRRDFVIF
jgi:hypothetical protein